MRLALLSLTLLSLGSLPTASLAHTRAVETASFHLPAFAPGVRARRWRYIIVHHSGTSGGSARAFEAYHRHVRHMPRGMAYHFVIGNGVGLGDGEVEVGSRWAGQLPGAHVASSLRDRDTGVPLDDVAIGICLVGNLDDTPPTARQVQSLRTLVASLRHAYAIDPSRIRGHGEVPGTHTACPGRRLDLVALRGG